MSERSYHGATSRSFALIFILTKKQKQKNNSKSIRLTGLLVAGVGLDDAAVKPHVGDGHSVLGQRASLVRADGGGGTQSLDGLKILHKTVLAGHTLGGQSQTHLGGNV